MKVPHDKMTDYFLCNIQNPCKKLRSLSHILTQTKKQNGGKRMTGKTKIYDNLAQLDKDAVLNEAALAAALGVHPRTVKRMEINGHIPRHFKLGVENCWIAGELINHFYKRASEAQDIDIKANESLSKYLP